MPKACGLVVAVLGTTVRFCAQLFTTLPSFIRGGGYKSSTVSPGYSLVISTAIHYSTDRLITVFSVIIPTIHTTNKYNKKFYINNLLVIYGKAV